jgi:hypothetical protein
LLKKAVPLFGFGTGLIFDDLLDFLFCQEGGSAEAPGIPGVITEVIKQA